MKKSVDESYDELKRKQKQLEHYIDEMRMIESQRVSNLSGRLMRGTQKYEIDSGQVSKFYS